MKWRTLALLSLLILSCREQRSLHQPVEPAIFQPPESLHGWTRSCDMWNDSTCFYRLYFEGKLIPEVHGRLLTPLGLLSFRYRRHAHAEGGWRKTCDETTDAVAVSGEPLSADELSVGFYQSPMNEKRPGTPRDWFYWTNVEQPGWVSPTRLFDDHFVASHPYSSPPDFLGPNEEAVVLKLPSDLADANITLDGQKVSPDGRGYRGFCPPWSPFGTNVTIVISNSASHELSVEKFGVGRIESEVSLEDLSDRTLDLSKAAVSNSATPSTSQ